MKNSQKLVMVVNGDQAILETIKDILQLENYQVFIPNKRIVDAEAVLQINPDLIIVCSLISNDYSGWELIQNLRVNQATVNIPILICTSETWLALARPEKFKTKHLRLIPQPFQVEDLLQAVNEMLGDRNVISP